MFCRSQKSTRFKVSVLTVGSLLAALLSSCGKATNIKNLSNINLHLNDSVGLAWVASPSPEVTGYRIHYGLESGDYIAASDVGLVTTVVLNSLPHAVLYFVATAYDAAGDESGYSNEVATSLTTSDPSAAIAIDIHEENGHVVIAALKAPGR